jgi:hypothetical protein
MGARTVAAVVVALLAGCGGSTSKTSNDSSTSRADGSVLLAAPAGTDPSTLSVAADVVRERLTRMKVSVSEVTARAEGVAVRSAADPYQLEAAARRSATTISTITATAIGPCVGSGTDGGAPAARCYTLGPALTGVAAVSEATAESDAGVGWSVALAVKPDAYAAFRRSLEAAGRVPVALVGDGVAVLAFDAGLPALRSVLSPGLTEEQARQSAAALVVDSDLPLALTAPPLPPPHTARVDVDFWTAALGVSICGAWLPNAPPAGLETGVHSHGDGLVYIHPFTEDEAGAQATLGLFLERGLWSASEDSLQLWDGTTHHNGETCRGGGKARVRWWVDGVEQQGNPSKLLPRDGHVVVLGFDSDPAPPGTPPQASALALPALAPATH